MKDEAADTRPTIRLERDGPLIVSGVRSLRNSRGEPMQTSLQNPSFAEYAQLCGGLGIRVTDPADLAAAFSAALEADGPALVEIMADPLLTRAHPEPPNAAHWPSHAPM